MLVPHQSRPQFYDIQTVLFEVASGARFRITSPISRTPASSGDLSPMHEWHLLKSDSSHSFVTKIAITNKLPMYSKHRY